MARINRQLWISLIVLGAVALIACATVFGGIEWALASLGLMTLIAMIAAGIHIAVNISKYTNKSIYNECLEYARTFDKSDSNKVEDVRNNTTEKVNKISQKDKQLIMTQIDEFFGIKTKEESQKSVIVKPVDKHDKKLIMAHINEIFENSSEYSKGNRY